MADRRAGRAPGLPSSTTRSAPCGGHNMLGEVAFRVASWGAASSAGAYVENAGRSTPYEIVRCAVSTARRQRRSAKASGLASAASTSCRRSSIDINPHLTPPSRTAAGAVTSYGDGRSPLPSTSNHEKPAREPTPARRRSSARRPAGWVCASSARRHLPRSAYQAGRSAIDAGAIGQPLSVSAAMLVGAKATWHPNPDIFYTDCAGPLFDLGPPYYLTDESSAARCSARFTASRGVRRLAAVERQRSRSGPRGQQFTATTPTHTSGRRCQLSDGMTANLVRQSNAATSKLESRSTGARASLLAARTRTLRRLDPPQVRGRGGWEDVPSPRAEAPTPGAIGACTTWSSRSPPVTAAPRLR